MPTMPFAQCNNFSKSIAPPIAALLFLSCLACQGHAQALRERFFMGMEASVNTPSYGGAASFSIAAEPKFWITNKFYAGLKCDVPLGSFGDNDGHFYDKPVLGAVSSIMLKGYVEQRFGYAKLFVGYGVGRLFSNEIYSPSYYPRNPAGQLDTTRLVPAWATAFSIGVKGDNMYFGLSFKKPRAGDDYSDIPSYMSTSLGIEFGSGKYLSSYKTVNVYELPPLMLEFGQQLSVPLGQSPSAVSRSVYAEMKVGIKGKYSIGARLADSPSEGYGTDAEGYPVDSSNVFPVDYSRKNTMKLVRSNTLFFDAYFPRENGWLYAGIGGGWYRFDGLETLEFGSGGSVVKVPGIPSSNKAGLVLRLGRKTGFFRAGLDLNLTGKGVPDYASFHVGLEPGVFIYRDKNQ